MVGDVKFDANTADSLDALEGMNVMINYVYPDSETMKRNREAYKRGQLIIAEHLQPYIPPARNFIVHRPAPCFSG